MRVYVILPAAGIGSRMSTGMSSGLSSGSGGGEKPAKQFMEIGGVPVLVYSLRAFAGVERVAEVLVAVKASEIARVTELIAAHGLTAKVRVVEGGENRQESVGRGLAALDCADDDVVLVHDAVRPMIDAVTIERTIDCVVKHGAAIVGLAAVDTIKQVERTADGAIVTSTIPRERVVHAQTPQGARFGLLKRAFGEAEADGFAGTDESSVLERAGVEVSVVAGSGKNFKITSPGDLELAEFYLGRGKA